MSLHALLDAKTLIPTLGLLGIFLVIFAESGLFFGFFLPGDSLLFTAGLFAASGQLNIFILIAGSFIAAVLGDSVGYTFGHKIGRNLFLRKESFWFRRKHLEKAENFYQRRGKSTIIIARFVPIIRTFAPIVAGVGQMTYKTFLSYNIIGGLLWTITLCSLGYFLGRTVPNIDHYLLPIIIVIIVVSFIPAVVTYIKERNQK